MSSIELRPDPKSTIGDWLRGWHVYAGDQYLGHLSRRNDGTGTYVASKGLGETALRVGSIGTGLSVLRHVHG